MLHWEKKVSLSNQREFCGIKKGFVLGKELENSFAHSKEPKKGFDFWNEFETFFGLVGDLQNL